MTKNKNQSVPRLTQNSSAVNRKNRRFTILSVLIIAFTGIIIYANSLNSSFHFDDFSAIVENHDIRDLSNIKAIWQIQFTRFITYYSFAVNYHFHQLNSFGYHLTNLLIHILSAATVWWVLRLTLETPAVKNSKVQFSRLIIPFIGGMIFVTHPVQTQAVTYITQRLASLTAFFYFLSLCLYIKGRLNRLHNGPMARRFLLFLMSLVSGLAALFSKETGYTLPFTIILYELFFIRDCNRPSWKSASLFLLPAALIVPVTYHFRDHFSQLSRTRVPGGLIELSSLDYLYTQFRVILTYIRLIFFPVNQNIDYDFPLSHSFLNPETFISFMIILAVLTGAVFLYRSYRPLSFSIFFFFIALSPESSIIPIRDVIFEHRLYLPLAGFCMFIPFLIYYLFRPRKQATLLYVFLPAILCLALATWQRNQIWKDEETLWTDAIIKSPGKSRPYAARAKAFLEIKDYTKAIDDCRQALRINPANEEAFIQMGAAYGYLNNKLKALECFNRAIEINPYRPAPYFNKSRIYRSLKKYDLALIDINQAIRYGMKDDTAFHEKGMILTASGKYPQAIDVLTRAIQLNPDKDKYYYSRGYCHMMNNSREKALLDFSRVVRLNPNHLEAISHIGMIQYRNGNLQKALETFSKAITINTNYAKAYNNRALIHFSLKNYRKAAKDIQKAVELGAQVHPEIYRRIMQKNHSP